MSHKENLKISKIIAEIVVFLLNRHIQLFDISFQRQGKTETIVLIVSAMPEELILEFERKMAVHREQEIETYGWSLLGESGLELAGLFIDQVHVESVDNQTRFTLIRSEKE